jgi:aminoglycoside 6'-N-acetyltransferase I
MRDHHRVLTGGYRVRPMAQGDIPAWVDLRLQLWPDETRQFLERQGREALAADPPWVVFVAEGAEDPALSPEAMDSGEKARAGELAGFLDLNLRPYADGCQGSPVPYVEGWYLRPEARGVGLGARLMAAAEAWAREKGFREMGSDASAGNLVSRLAHRALGFAEVETLVVFRKPI